VLIVIFITVLVSPLWNTDPDGLFLMDQGTGPSSAHPLGVATGGTDILSRLLAGGRYSLLFPLIVVTLSTAVGLAIAVTSAWFGGWFDAAVNAVTNMLFAIPGILLAILATAVFGVSLTVVVVSLAISYVPFVTRLIRAAAVKEASMAYVAALRIQGVSGWVACTRHLLPNVRRLVVAQSSLAFGYAALDLAALSFIGLGVQQPSADWGVMVASGLPGLIGGYPWEAIAAGGALVVTLVSSTVLSDSLGTERNS